jgi:hypothetical protein
MRDLLAHELQETKHKEKELENEINRIKAEYE